MKKNKMITLTSSYGKKLIEVPKVEGAWFNTKHNLRDRLYEADSMTLVQWITTSNKTILETLDKMDEKEVLKLKKQLTPWCSKRQAKVNDLINWHLSKRGNKT